MSTNPIQSTAPYSEEQIAAFKSEFSRDGFLLIPDVLNEEEIVALKTGVDHVFGDERWKRSKNVYSPFVAVRLFETDPIFEDMLTREPIIGLVESILGTNCHLIAQNIVRNAPGQAIDIFHVDDQVIFPVADGESRHNPNLTMPVFMLTIQIPLTDIPALEYGPTEFIAGSHYAGRNPEDSKNPNFEGQSPTPILCKAGDIYLHNGQCWHRGAPNTSDRTRYLFQMSFGMRWVSQRFYPFVNYQLPAHVMERADARRLRVLGIHGKGAYG